MSGAGVPWLTLVELLARLLAGGALVLVATAVLTRRVGSGAERQRLWSVALALLVLLPAVALLPSVSVPIPEPARAAWARLLPAGAGEATPIARSREVSSTGGKPATSSPAAPTVPAVESPEPAAAANPSATSPGRPSSGAAPPARRLSSLADGVSAVLLAIWSLGVVVLLAGAARAALTLRRRTAEALVLDGSSDGGSLWKDDLERVRGELGVRAPVRLIVHSEIRTPMTWGLRRPVVALPPAALSWSRQERRAVLVHELAHVRRRDSTRLLAGRLACILHWPDPLVWRALRRLAVEQELACDRMVVDRGVLPSSYARQLLELCRATPTPKLSGALAMARKSSLEVRLMSLLDPHSPPTPHPPRSPRARLLALGAALVVLAVGAVVLEPAEPASAVVRAPLVQPLVAAVPSARPVPAGTARQQPSTDAGGDSLSEALIAARALEEEMEVYHRRMQEVEREMRSAMEPLEELEERLAPHHDAIRRLEEEQRELAEPLRQLERQIEAEHGEVLAELESRLATAQREIEAESEPLRAELETLHRELERLTEPLEQGRDADAAVRQRIEEIHREMEPVHRRLEQLHQRMEPLHHELEERMRLLEPRHRELEERMRALEPQHQRMEEIHSRMESVHREMEEVQRGLEPFHQRMEALQREMEPIHRRMEEVHRRLDRAVTAELRRVLADELGELGLSGARLDAAAEDVRDAVSFHVDDRRLRLRASRAELRELLAEIAGVGDGHPAVERAVDALLDLDTRFD